MNERRNHVTDSHKGIFKWIFETDPALDATEKEPQLDRDSGLDDDSASSLAPPRDRKETDRPWDNFQEWLLSESDIYWISGKAGSGKSTLVKFLVTSEHTQAALNPWREATVILSHFFWAPGGNMQNNLKGLFCSLLHQALSQLPALLDGIVTQAKSYRDKDHDTDWSVNELRSLCMNTLASYPVPVCIFLDGLDEICEDDAAKLLDLVDDLRAIPDVKICVASRPEVVFKRRLGHHQQMRVHDLTQVDMWTYARSILKARRPPESANGQSASRQEFPSSIIRNIVYKAEGVFLWLHLVTRSLLRGWEKGDDETELASRLDIFPSELFDLYADMWSRLNEDSGIYRKAAADLFYLVLTATSYNRGLDTLLTWKADLLHCVALTTPWFQAKALDLSSDMEKDETMGTLCDKAEASIQRLCAGLLEVSRPQARGILTGDINAGELSTVTFIHRTAYDFLTDSEKGREILSPYRSQEDEGYLRLASAVLAGTRYKKIAKNGIQALCSILRCVKSPALKRPVFEALHLAWQFLDAGHLTCNVHMHYLSIMASEGFEDYALFIIPRLAPRSEIATHVLSELLVVVGKNPRIWVPRAELTGSLCQRLIRLGADPNSRPASSCVRWYPFAPRVPTKLTPYGRCVSLALAGVFPGIQPPLDVFLQAGLAPEGRFPLYIKLDTEGKLRCDSEAFERELFTDCELEPATTFAEWMTPMFVLDASLPLLLEAVKRRAGEQGPTINTQTRCRNPGATTSCAEDILAPAVIIEVEFTAALRFRIVEKHTRANLASLFKSWLFADDESRAEVENEIGRLGDGIMRDIAAKSEAYEATRRPLWDILEEEGCCFRR